MSALQITKGYVYQGSAVVLLARVIDVDGEPTTSEDFAEDATATVKVIECDGDEQIGDDLFPELADILTDELDTNANLWTIDETGFNLKLVLDGETYLPDGGKSYAVEMRLRPQDAPQYFITWELEARRLRGNW